MNLAIVGCGYVADMYASTLSYHSGLSLLAACDTNQGNVDAFVRRWPARRYSSLDQVLADSSVDLVLNLTDPRSHYVVTKRCLQAGKNVYSEKPLAMEGQAAAELVSLAKQCGVYLGAAPCSLLSDTAQTVWRALREGVIGRVRLIYANFDDGMIAPKRSPWLWQNECGVRWPAKDEFEVGCTYEHAGYILTWLAAFFGPALRVTSFASCLIPDKGIAVDTMAPDFTVGCIEYGEGVVARVTCGLVAPRDKSLIIVGDDGVLTVADLRNDRCPVYLRQIPAGRREAALESRVNRLRKFLRMPGSEVDWHYQRRRPFARRTMGRFVGPGKPVDFCRGPAEMAEAIRQRRPCRLSAELGLHIVELVDAIQYPERFDGKRAIQSTFDPIQPLPWTT